MCFLLFPHRVVASQLANGEAQDAIDSGTPDYQGRRWSAREENRSTQRATHETATPRWESANLHSAYREVAANRGAPGVDHVTIEDFTAGLTRNIDKLEQQLRDGTYRPQSIKRVHIPKPGTK